MEAASHLRLVGDDAASSFPWPETGEVLSITDAHYRIRDLIDERDGLLKLTAKQARVNAQLERRVAEDESAESHAKGKEIVELIERWKAGTGHPKSKTSGDRIKLVKARLKDGYSVEQLELAIDGIAAYPYVGTGGQRFRDGKPGQRHDRLGIALGGGEAVEKFAVLGHEARKAGWTPEEGWR